MSLVIACGHKAPMACHRVSRTLGSWTGVTCLPSYLYISHFLSMSQPLLPGWTHGAQMLHLCDSLYGNGLTRVINWVACLVSPTCCRWCMLGASCCGNPQTTSHTPQTVSLLYLIWWPPLGKSCWGKYVIWFLPCRWAQPLGLTIILGLFFWVFIFLCLTTDPGTSAVPPCWTTWQVNCQSCHLLISTGERTFCTTFFMKPGPWTPCHQAWNGMGIAIVQITMGNSTL